MTVGYSIPVLYPIFLNTWYLFRMVFDFLIVLRKRTSILKAFFGFIVTFLYPNQSGEFIYAEPFVSFTFSKLIFKIARKFKTKPASFHFLF